jgi:site-specific recombinase XerD
MKRIPDEENEMTAIAKRITATPAGNPQELALRIKQEAPGLADLAPDQLEMIARLVMTQRLAAELNAAVDLAGIDWNQKRETFLGDARSDHTRRAYAAALGKLETWASREGINPLEMNAATADQFIRTLKAEGKAAATTRRDIAAISAFFTWLERYHAQIKNPVRGTRIRPPKENKKDTVIPSDADYKTILAELPPVEKAIIITMATRGLRAGALITLVLKGSKYHGKSKGKILEEAGTPGITLPTAAIKAIKAAGLDIKRPFLWKTKQGTENTANAIEGRINYYIGKLFREGKIGAAYSCHDFRHYFATNEYKKNKDIFRLSKLLNHAGIQITQVYLKSLGIEL